MAQIFEIHPLDPQRRLVKQAAALLQKGYVLAVPTASSYAWVGQIGDKNAVNLAGQGVAGVGRYGKHWAFVQQGGGWRQQARLRVVGVDFKKLCHSVQSFNMFIGCFYAARRMRLASSSHTGVTPRGRGGRLPNSVCDSSGL